MNPFRINKKWFLIVFLIFHLNAEGGGGGQNNQKCTLKQAFLLILFFCEFWANFIQTRCQPGSIEGGCCWFFSDFFDLKFLFLNQFWKFKTGLHGLLFELATWKNYFILMLHSLKLFQFFFGATKKVEEGKLGGGSKIMKNVLWNRITR